MLFAGDCRVLILDISIPHQMSPGDLFSYKKGRERKVRSFCIGHIIQGPVLGEEVAIVNGERSAQVILKSGD